MPPLKHLTHELREYPYIFVRIASMLHGDAGLIIIFASPAKLPDPQFPAENILQSLIGQFNESIF